MKLENNAEDFNKNLMIKEIANIRSKISNLLVLVSLRRKITYSFNTSKKYTSNIKENLIL